MGKASKTVVADRITTYSWRCPSCNRVWAVSSIKLDDDSRIFNKLDIDKKVEVKCKCGEYFKVTR